MTEKVEASPPDFEGPPTGLAARVAELEESIRTLNDLVAQLNARMARSVEDLKEEIHDRADRSDVALFRKDLDKIAARVDEALDEVGFGERLDPSKVPPAILEQGYQAILDDIVGELKRARGTHDSERYIVQALEQLRLRTSGSEFFHFRPHVHRIEVGVRKPLEKGLVSARQVQMTYEELQRHLLEPIHYHQPRNFRALVKAKSQEFAVDRALHLTRDAEQAGARTSALQERLTRLEAQVAGALRDVQDFAANLRETLENVATRESVEALQMRLSSMEARLATTGSRTDAPSLDFDAQRILAVLRGGDRTEAELRRELHAPEAPLREALRDFESRGLIVSSLRGRTTTYRLREVTDDA